MAEITATLDRPFARATAQSPWNLPVAIAAIALVAGAMYLGATVNGRQAALFLVGTGAGLVLYHAAFGFTSAWRHFISEGRGAELRAQMLMLAATCLVFFPVLASGEFFGRAVRGSMGPLGLSVVAGAFLFGVGMQLGGGCASGTLYSVGGGSTRMLVTLAAFIAGSVAGAAHMHLWEQAPAWPAVSLVARLGAAGGLAVSFVLFGAVWAATTLVERRRHREITPGVIFAAKKTPGVISAGERRRWARFARGPWPLAAGALGLAAVNIATLALAGRPWGVTSAFALWGSKTLAMTGVDVAAWPYWATPARTAELGASVFRDVTSVMDFGIIIGAFAAAGLAGRFAPVWRVPARSLAAAVLGGMLLGYGARIAYGCNIGAFFSGVASGSLHGWLWFVAAFAGNMAGTRLRPVFGLSR